MKTRSSTATRMEYRNRGYMGFVNLGNTCFLNSCLQVLNHTYELNQVFLVDQLHLRHGTPKNGEATMFVKEWVDLQRLIWSAEERGAISPGRFVNMVQHLAKVRGRDLFTGWAQNDMPEFLQFVVDIMHESVARPVKMRISGKRESNRDTLAVECYNMLRTVYQKEYSEVMDMFYGIYVSMISQVGAEGVTVVSQKPEMFFMIDLPIPTRQGPNHNINLYDCFDRFTARELMEGENAWYNEKTRQRETATKEIIFWNLPKVLVVTLKRFHGDGIRKRQDLVDFPLTDLDLAKYVCGYQAESYKYDLYGVCNHTGGILGGHYYCYVKNASDEWLCFNDAQCTKMDTPADTIVTPAAYCLFYRKGT